MYFNFFDEIQNTVRTSLMIDISNNNNYNYLYKFILLPIFFSIYFLCIDRFKQIFKIGIFKYIKLFWNICMNKNAEINFEVCLTRLNHTLRIESDHGYNAIRYYLFKNYKNIYGLKNLRKIPRIFKNEFDVKKKNNDEIDNAFFKDLYIGDNIMELPNGLLLKCNLNIHTPNDKESYDNPQKFYFRSKLMCIKYKTANENLAFLVDEYEKLINDFSYYIKNQKIENQYCYIYDNHHEENPYFNKLYIGEEYRTFNGIFFPEKDNFLENLDFFINNKEFFKKKGKPYRKIILAHGEPGCGKTSIILGLLNLLDKKYGQKRQLIHLNLAKLSKKDLQNIFFNESIYVNDHEDGRETIPFNRRIYYIEEIDGYKSTLDRNNVTDTNENIKTKIKGINEENDNIKNYITAENKDKDKDDPLSVQDFIELLDGPISIKNSEIIVMTTNYIDKIDKALIRAGRVNHLFHMKKSTVLDMKNIINFYFDSDISINKLDLFEDYDFSPAVISEICNSVENSDMVIKKLLENKSR